MRKRITALLCLLALLTGCSAPPKEDRLTVVAAIFPEYDWVRQIIGDTGNIELKLLIDDGVDPHSFQPTAGDMVTVADCDLLIFGGGESDEWLEDAVPESGPEMLALLPLLGDRAHQAEYTEGMQLREEEDETDEHVWLSLRNAMFFCREITEVLCRLDAANSETYRKNLESYLAQLNELDLRYQEMVGSAGKDTILVCDRFPFRYLTEDYGIHYYAAFPGCSAESGASFATMKFLIDKTRELDLHTLLITEGSDGRIADTVARDAGDETANVRILDSMQAVSLQDAAKRDYLSIMEQNLEVLAEALAG